MQQHYSGWLLADSMHIKKYDKLEEQEITQK